MNKFLRFILMKNVTGITLSPFGIYIRKGYENNPRRDNHESIHWYQQLEMLIIFFYIWYFIEWIIRKLFTTTSNAYRDISFEQEAYENDQDMKYLKIRKHYSWLKHICKKSK